jgi:hypothetical protein
MSTGPTDSGEIARLHNSAREAIREAMKTLKISETVVPSGTEAYTPRRSADPDLPPAPPVRRMVLVDRGDGALEWRDPEPTAPASLPRRSFDDLAAGTRNVAEVPVEILEPNKILEKLIDWDNQLTPSQGLRRWTGTNGFEPIAAVPSVQTNPDGSPGKILLIVHGTFSNSEAIFNQLAQVETDSQFLAWAASKYQHILTFDHPTISVSPVLNALDLTRLFADVATPVDVICHSRGGLVVRWWLEAFSGAKTGTRRVVFVASPLGGTSLASPARIRDAFNLFTTVGSYLKDAGQVASVFIPFTTIAVGLMQIFVSVTGIVANTPLADLFFNAVPGLGAMSRVGNNTELARLQSGPPSLPQYFAVYSDFQMEKAGWRFWKLFQNPSLRMANWGASLIFEQANDLVVDNRASIELFKGKGIPRNRLLIMETNGKVFHTNYFLQLRMLKELQQFLA